MLTVKAPKDFTAKPGEKAAWPSAPADLYVFDESNGRAGSLRSALQE